MKNINKHCLSVAVLPTSQAAWKNEEFKTRGDHQCCREEEHNKTERCIATDSAKNPEIKTKRLSVMNDFTKICKLYEMG